VEGRVPSTFTCQGRSSVLDEEAKEEVEGLILKIVQQNELTCAVVSYNLAQTARIASRIMIADAREDKFEVCQFSGGSEIQYN